MALSALYMEASPSLRRHSMNNSPKKHLFRRWYFGIEKQNQLEVAFLSVLEDFRTNRFYDPPPIPVHQLYCLLSLPSIMKNDEIEFIQLFCSLSPSQAKSDEAGPVGFRKIWPQNHKNQVHSQYKIA